LQSFNDNLSGGWAPSQLAAGVPFTPNRLTQMVREYVNAANIGKSGSCHLFRHTMATLMLENGADIRYIQAMLGHAELSTTQIYTQVSIRKLKQIHTATHLGKVRTARNAAPRSECGRLGGSRNRCRGCARCPGSRSPQGRRRSRPHLTGLAGGHTPPQTVQPCARSA
jgi:hypothetical protein